MRQYIGRRLALTVPIILGITVLVFALIELAPGDLVDAMVPRDLPLSEEELQVWRQRLGLDRPAPLRYLEWLRQVARGNLGYSYTQHRPVRDLISVRLPPTLQLMAFSLAPSTVLGLALGVISALRQYSLVDYLTTGFALIWISIPGFFLALLMVYLFAVKVPLFPAFGYSKVDARCVLCDRLHHLVLPGVTLGLELTASLTRYTRNSLLEVLNNDYVRTARAKGLGEVRVVLRHALPNALIPVLTVIGLRLPILFGGSIIIESMFQWPGMGSLVIKAANSRDFPIIMGVSLLTTTMVVLSNLVVDLAYAVVDPRIRYG